MNDTRTEAEKKAAEALIKDFIKRRDEEQAKRSNPLQQPSPRYPGAPAPGGLKQ